MAEQQTATGFGNLPASLVQCERGVCPVLFDSQQHLDFREPDITHTLGDFGIDDVGISPIAVTAPFSLFTAEAVRQMRAEIFSESVLNDFYCETSPNSGQIRGYCPKCVIYGF